MSSVDTNELCERIRQIAAAEAQAAYREMADRAASRVASAKFDARKQADAALQAARERLDKEANRAAQDAELHARRRLTKARWSELDEVMEAAWQEIAQLCRKEPERYRAAVHHWLQGAQQQLDSETLHASCRPETLPLLQDGAGDPIQWHPQEMGPGIVITSEDGHRTLDQSLAERMKRLGHELRLMASEILFSGDAATGAEQSEPESFGDAYDLTYRGTLDFAGSILQVRGARGVGYQEQAEIVSGKGSVRSGQVLMVSEQEAAVQVFEGTKGLSRQETAIRFLGKVPELTVSEELLGRVFDGLGRPRDGLPPILGRDRRPIAGLPMNPLARTYPREFIQTGISSIDVMNSLVRGQKLPVFSGSGLPHNQLLSQILRQARLLEETSAFAVVFITMGIAHSDARFFQDVFAQEGVIDRVSMFLNLADDPAMTRLAAPRAGLTAAEYLAFDLGYHVLVILTDIANYANALREIATARNEVPARKGYPGYLYSDLAEIYERAGRLHGRHGSITMMPLVTLHNDDITHPVPDLTGYITEGQLMLSREMDSRGISPPMDVLPSLSRLMKDGVGPDDTREDHPNLASQLYAAYAEGRRVRDLAMIVGEADLSDLDQSYLRFSRNFEEHFIAQPADEERTIAASLDLGWSLLRTLPKEEMNRVTEEQLERYYSKQEESNEEAVP